MEFVDDLMTFEDLAEHLRSRGCHVANLSSLEFSADNGTASCIRSLLRQFLSSMVDVRDYIFLMSSIHDYAPHGCKISKFNAVLNGDIGRLWICQSCHLGIILMAIEMPQLLWFWMTWRDVGLCYQISSSCWGNDLPLSARTTMLLQFVLAW